MEKPQYIVYKKETCKIIDILKNYFKGEDYYILTPIKDSSLTIKVPVNNKELRGLINKAEIEKIIKKIPSIPIIDTNSKNLENIYKELLQENSHENLIRIIKTSYLRNKERIDNNKKTTDKDNYYFELAENYLYEEFQIVLGMSYDETKNYVISKVAELTSK